MKEAIIAFEKILVHQSQGKKQSADEQIVITDDQKVYLFKMISVINSKFGTVDSEWFCAAEAILNAMFNIKSRNSHEYAKLFIEQLVRKLYLMPQNERQS